MHNNYPSNYIVIIPPLAMFTIHKVPSKGYLVSPVLLQDVSSPTGWTAAPGATVGWTPLSAASLASTGNCRVQRKHLYCYFLKILKTVRLLGCQSLGTWFSFTIHNGHFSSLTWLVYTPNLTIRQIEPKTLI